MRTAVLAVQGAFIEHERRMRELGAECFEIRQKRDLDQPFDGLILPGGESTVMRKLLHELDLFETLLERIKSGMPVFGTCAGLLLLARNVENAESFVPCFATMDLTARRNAYGRQLGSFHAEEPFGTLGNVPMTFIRAPFIESVGPKVEVLARVDGKIAAARQGNQLVTAFHPELDPDLRIHAMFCEMMRGRGKTDEKPA